MATASGDEKSFEERVRALLTRGEPREAVDLAKEAVKKRPGRASEELLVEAYGARIEGLAREGLHREALALHETVVARFPWSEATLAAVRDELSLTADGFRALLEELAAATPDRARTLLSLLSRSLTDPAILADSPHLADDHQLKGEARAVRDLLVAVTTGPVPREAFAPLDPIGRTSPLAPWKLLVRAIQAFYEGDPARALRNAAAIPAESAVASLVPALKTLAGEPQAVPLSRASKRLVERVSAVASSHPHLLAELDEAFRKRRVEALKTLLPAADALDLPADVRRLFRRTVAERWFEEPIEPESLARLFQARTRLDWIRVSALALEKYDRLSAIELWHRFLKEAQQAGVLPAHGPDPGAILLRMTSLFPEDEDALLEDLGTDTPAQLRADIRQGFLPAAFDQERIVNDALAAHPTSAAYRAKFELHRKRGGPRASETATSTLWEWKRAFPEDPAVAVLLAESLEGDRLPEEALVLLEPVAAASLDPAIRRQRRRLLFRCALERAALHLMGEESLWPKLAAEGAAFPDGDLLARVLFWAAAQSSGEADAGPTRAQIEGHPDPVFARLVASCAGRLTRVPWPHRFSSRDVPDLPATLVRLFRLGEPLDIDLFPSPDLLLEVSLRLGPGTPPADLLVLGNGAWLAGSEPLAARCSSLGLLERGDLLSDFLLRRAQALLLRPKPPVDRISDCIHAAYATAADDGRGTREKIASALETMMRRDTLVMLRILKGSPPAEQRFTELEAAKVIRRESLPEGPAPQPAPRPSPRPSKRKRKETGT